MTASIKTNETLLQQQIQGIQADPRKPRQVVAAMSGGVDSSVAAYLMKQAGVEVIGVTLRLRPCSEDQPEQRKACCGAEDSLHARVTASRIGIDHYFLDYQKEFFEEILTTAWKEYSRGRTPNPCVLCNRFLKFGRLVQYAEQIGADGIVTGHYARILPLPDREGIGLFRGIDPVKDQSYFLFGIEREVLARCWFPLGSLEKKDVRALARVIGLSNAEKRESQDACFGVPGESFADTLRRLFNEKRVLGNFVDETGKVLGPHTGIHNYTLGQRRGLNVALGKRLYVSRIDPETGTIVLSSEEEALRRSSLEAEGVNWLDPFFRERPFKGEVQVRYTQHPVPGEISPSEEGIRIQFKEPIRAITPGQAAVVYKGEEVICGGWIR